MDQKQRQAIAADAFTLTELLVVIAVLALLAVTQLLAVSGAKSPVRHTVCMSNLRQIGAATLLYLENHDDYYPTGQRTTSWSTFNAVTSWPRLLLPYMGGFESNGIIPTVLMCPNEKTIINTTGGTQGGMPIPIQLHFVGNRNIISDINDSLKGVRGSVMRNPSIYWMFMEKGAFDFGNTSPGTLEQLNLTPWNVDLSYGSAMRRHNGGETAVAADGHVECLRMPPYQPGKPSPGNFWELGWSVTGNQGVRGNWVTNGPLVKLWTAYNRTGFF